MQSDANVIHLTLLKEEGSTSIILVMPPLQLHLLMGAVNAAHKLLIKEYDWEYVENMLHSLRIIRKCG